MTRGVVKQVKKSIAYEINNSRSVIELSEKFFSKEFEGEKSRGVRTLKDTNTTDGTGGSTKKM